MQNINHQEKALEIAKQSLIYHHPEEYECHLLLYKPFLGMLVVTVNNWPNKIII